MSGNERELELIGGQLGLKLTWLSGEEKEQLLSYRREKGEKKKHGNHVCRHI